MQPVHIILAVLIAMVWGINFIFVQCALNEIPPLLLCTLRFFFASVPFVFFIKKPQIPFKWLFLYSFFTFILQFILLFGGMAAGMPPGLSSIVLQVQMFFSIFFAAVLLGEQPKNIQLVGSAIAFCGIGVICIALGASASFWGFILLISAAASWGLGNVISKKIGRVNVIGLIAWGSLYAALTLFALSLLISGPTELLQSTKNLSWLGLSAILYIAYISTWIGYGFWVWLLNNYPVSTVVPFALLVPVFGMISSMIIFDEPLQPWKLSASLFIMLGLIINIFGPRWLALFGRDRSA